mmetsp:Transcript_15349/g.33199  ORF Transcript_15349/g.33199 Transcript_15349/m.33199 type:complete len:581 (-) Transcript_15349:136-1878(-)
MADLLEAPQWDSQALSDADSSIYSSSRPASESGFGSDNGEDDGENGLGMSPEEAEEEAAARREANKVANSLYCTKSSTHWETRNLHIAFKNNGFTSCRAPVSLPQIPPRVSSAETQFENASNFEMTGGLSGTSPLSATFGASGTNFEATFGASVTNPLSSTRRTTTPPDTANAMTNKFSSSMTLAPTVKMAATARLGPARTMGTVATIPEHKLQPTAMTRPVTIGAGDPWSRLSHKPVLEGRPKGRRQKVGAALRIQRWWRKRQINLDEAAANIDDMTVQSQATDPALWTRQPTTSAAPRAISPLLSGEALHLHTVLTSVLGDRATRPLAEAARQEHPMTAIALRYLALGPKGAQRVAQVLDSASIIVNVELQGNYVLDEGVGYLVPTFTNLPILQKLSLAGNAIGDEGAYHLSELMSIAPKLVELDLSFNRIGDQGAQHIGFVLEALKKRKKALASCLKLLNLKQNRIGEDGIGQLWQGQQGDNGPWLRLDVSSNPGESAIARLEAEAEQQRQGQLRGVRRLGRRPSSASSSRSSRSNRSLRSLRSEKSDKSTRSMRSMRSMKSMKSEKGGKSPKAGRR